MKYPSFALALAAGAAFFTSIAGAETQAAPVNELVGVRIFAVNQEVVGVTSDFQMVGFDCSIWPARSTITFPVQKGRRVLTENYFKSSGGRSPSDTAPFKYLSVEAAKAICANDGLQRELTLNLAPETVQLVGSPEVVQVKAFESVRRPF